MNGRASIRQRANARYTAYSMTTLSKYAGRNAISQTRPSGKSGTRKPNSKKAAIVDAALAVRKAIMISHQARKRNSNAQKTKNSQLSATTPIQGLRALTAYGAKNAGKTTFANITFTI